MRASFSRLLALIFITAPAWGAAFGFWLDAPSRSNPFDPKNPDHMKATPFVFPVAPPANTFTKTATLTQTPVFTATASPTQSPYFSPTPSASATPSSTESPYFSPTTSPTPSMSPTMAPTHSALIADFENNATNDRTLWNGGAVFTVKDSVSSQNPNPWGPTSGTAGGAYGASSFAACMNGTMAVQIPPNQYTYCFIAFELVPGGSANWNQGGLDTDVRSYSPNHGLSFDYKAGATGVGTLYRIKLVSTDVHDFGYYEYDFTPADTAWHSVQVYFPGVSGVTALFAQPAWGAAVPFDASHLGAIMVEPIPQTSGAVNYDLCVDNLSFAVPAPATPVPSPTFGTGTMIMDFENNSAANVDNAPFAQSVSTGLDSLGSSILPHPWAPNSGSGPGSNAGGASSLYAGCFSGSLIQQVPATNTYPYAVMELLLAPSGWGNGGGKVNVTPLAPGNRLIFDYKAGTAGIQYSIQIITQNISDYSFYEYFFTPSNTSWNTQAVYFPGSAFSPQFSKTWGMAAPWDPTQVGEILVRPVPSNGGPVNFDLCIDNLRFD